jgi:hypothetical protein
MLAGCDQPISSRPAYNPNSTFHESSKDVPPDQAAAPLSEPRLSPMTRVLRAYPKDDYERKVLYMYEIMQAPDATQQVCARWFPDYGRSTLDALVAWQRRQDPVLTEIRDRTHAIWISQADGDSGVIPAVEGRFSDDRYQIYLHDFDRTQTAVYKKRCAGFPKMLASPQWDLQQKFRKELALVRQRPVPVSVHAGRP